MPRINVMELKDNENIEYFKNPEMNIHELTDFYRKKMIEATEVQAEVLNFGNIPFVEKKSQNFQNIYILEKCIIDYLKDNEFPKKVQIVCTDKKTAELYKVVYNFYYPGSKAERLDDENWD